MSAVLDALAVALQNLLGGILFLALIALSHT